MLFVEACKWSLKAKVIMNDFVDACEIMLLERSSLEYSHNLSIATRVVQDMRMDFRIWPATLQGEVLDRDSSPESTARI